MDELSFEAVFSLALDVWMADGLENFFRVGEEPEPKLHLHEGPHCVPHVYV
jgi:hypothetical protein